MTVKCENTSTQSSKSSSKQDINDRLASLDELLQMFHASNATGPTNDEKDPGSKDYQSLSSKHQQDRKEILNSSQSSLFSPSLVQESSQESSPESRGEAKGPILSGLGSLVAMNIIKKRCCAMKLCPCRLPGAFPGSGIPPNVINGISVPGQGMYPGMNGMQGGMNGFGGGGFGGFPGFYPGMRPGMGGGMGGHHGGGGGGGEGEELSEGFDESGYSIRPRPKRRRPVFVNSRPVGGSYFRPGNSIKWSVAGSAPESGFDHPEENAPVLENIPGGMYTATQNNGQAVSASSHHQISQKTEQGDTQTIVQDVTSTQSSSQSSSEEQVPNKSNTANLGRRLLSIKAADNDDDEWDTCFLHREEGDEDSPESLAREKAFTISHPNRFKRSPSSLPTRRRTHSSSSGDDARDTRGDINSNHNRKHKSGKRIPVDQMQGSSGGQQSSARSALDKKKKRNHVEKKISQSNKSNQQRVSKKKMKGANDSSSSSSSIPTSSGNTAAPSSSSRSRTRTQRTIG